MKPAIWLEIKNGAVNGIQFSNNKTPEEGEHYYYTETQLDEWRITYKTCMKRALDSILAQGSFSLKNEDAYLELDKFIRTLQTKLQLNTYDYVSSLEFKIKELEKI